VCNAVLSFHLCVCAVCLGHCPVHVSIISCAVVYELSVAVVVNSYELMEFLPLPPLFVCCLPFPLLFSDYYDYFCLAA